MSHNTPKQHTLWLLAAIAAPAAHFSGSGWFMAALTALAVLPLMLLPKSWEGMPKIGAVLQILWLGVAAGALLPASAAYWPSDNDLVVPLTLLTLAAFTGASSAPRVGAVLAFCMALLAIPAAVSGAAHAEPEWLRPQLAPWPLGLTLVLLLPNLPAAGESEKGKRILGATAAAIAPALLVQAVTATPVAMAAPDPLYQTARGLGHLEPVVAAGMTLGWYALACWLFHSAVQIAKGGGMGERLPYVLVWGTATALVLFRQQPGEGFLTVLSLFWWVITPFFQKMKKVKKGA